MLRGLLPTRSTFYRFRKHLPAELVDELNRSVLLLAQAEGHTTADNGSLDGTFTAAYGSRHRLLNRITLARRLHLLDDAIATANAGDANRRGVLPRRAEPSGDGRNGQPNHRVHPFAQRSRWAAAVTGTGGWVQPDAGPRGGATRGRGVLPRRAEPSGDGRNG